MSARNSRKFRSDFYVLNKVLYLEKSQKTSISALILLRRYSAWFCGPHYYIIFSVEICQNKLLVHHKFYLL